MNVQVTASTQSTIHAKSVMVMERAVLASHFFFEKDERKLRARDVSLDSQTYSPHGGEYEY